MTVTLTHNNWNEFEVALSVVLGARGTAIVITDDPAYKPSSAAYNHYCDAARTIIFASVSDAIRPSLNTYAKLSARDLWLALKRRFKPKGPIVLQRGINGTFLDGKSPPPAPIDLHGFEIWAARITASMDIIR